MSVTRSEYPETVKGALAATFRRCRRDGRSYYVLVYRDGRVVEEWPQSDPRYVDWTEQNFKGVIEAHLLCPNDQACAFSLDMLRAYLQSRGRVIGPRPDLDGRLFQYKRASLDTEVSYNKFRTLADVVAYTLKGAVEGKAPSKRVEGQVLGLVIDGEGHCRYAAWWYPGRLIVAEDRFPDIQVRGPQETALYPAHVGIHHT